MTKSAFENAITVDMAFGGSSNTTLHFLAIANETKVKLTLDDFEKISRGTHYLCSLSPGGPHFLEDLYWAGGIQALMSVLSKNGKINLNELTVTEKKLEIILKVYL